MILHIGEVLDAARCAAIVDAMGPRALWRDGSETAFGRARLVKRNLQADPEAGPTRAAKEMIERAVLAHLTVQSAALPDRLVRVLISRTEAGMGYGDHVDASYIDGWRTDLSFTLFLNAPDSYDGGELTLLGHGSIDAIKLPAGSIVLYPATTLHRVETVQRGIRVVAAGWIKSRVRSADARTAIFELDQVYRIIESLNPPGEALDRLQNVKNNLTRLHGE